jgi:hypothetical protein
MQNKKVWKQNIRIYECVRRKFSNNNYDDDDDDDDDDDNHELIPMVD